MLGGGIAMRKSSRLFGHWATITRADLALMSLYAWFVAINLSAVYRGDLSVLVLIMQECCVIGLALSRRRPSITAHWESPEALLGWCGTLAPLFVRPVDLAATLLLWVGLAAQGIGNVLAVVGICDLGRSFGIVAAHRGIQTGGLYQYLRHPIYAAYLLAFGGFVVTHPSVHNSVVLLVWAGFQIARIHVEEHLLAADPFYQVYAMQIRPRLLPGLSRGRNTKNNE